MPDRPVCKTGKNNNGDITSLCDDGSWSPRAKADAIRDIELGLHKYHVPWKEERADRDPRG